MYYLEALTICATALVSWNTHAEDIIKKEFSALNFRAESYKLNGNTSSVPGMQYDRFPSQAATCPQRRQHLHCFRGRELCFFDVVHFPTRWCQKLGMCSHLFTTASVPRGFSIYNDRRDESGECMLRHQNRWHPASHRVHTDYVLR